jgi:hypothetical protein
MLLFVILILILTICFILHNIYPNLHESVLCRLATGQEFCNCVSFRCVLHSALVLYAIHEVSRTYSTVSHLFHNNYYMRY